MELFLLVYLPPLASLLLFGGRRLIGWLSLCYLFVWVLDLLNFPLAGALALAALHGIGVLVLWSRCYEVYSSSLLLSRSTTAVVNTTTVSFFLPVCILMFTICSLAWLLLQFAAFRKSVSSTFEQRLRQIIIHMIGPISTALTSWTLVSIAGPNRSPYISLCVTLLNYWILHGGRHASGRRAGEMRSVNNFSGVVEFAASAWLLIPAILQLAIQHKMFSIGASLESQAVVVSDAATLFFIPITYVAVQRMPTAASKCYRLLVALLLLASALCIITEHSIKLYSMLSRWAFSAVMSGIVAGTFLVILPIVRVKIPPAMEYIFLLAVSFGAMILVVTPVMVATLLAPALAWCGLMLHASFSESSSSNVLAMFGDQGMNSGRILSTSGAQYMACIVVIVSLGLSSAAFNLYWNVADGNHLYNINIPILPSVKHISVGALSQLVVWANAALCLVPMLLHRGKIAFTGIGCCQRLHSLPKRQEWISKSLAGKAFVFHAAALALIEDIVLNQVLPVRIHSTKFVYSVFTSIMGTWISYLLVRHNSKESSPFKSQCLMKAPVQDAWMAACIHISKLGAYIEYDHGVGADNGEREVKVGVFMGTFIIICVLSAPFVWYERGTRTQIMKTPQLNVGSRRSVKITPKLAMAHVVAAVLSCSLYRNVIIDNVLPFVGGLLSDYPSLTLWHSGIIAQGPCKSLIFGVEMSIIGLWLFVLLAWHFPQQVQMRRAAAGLLGLGLCFALVQPSVDAREVLASLLFDCGHLHYVQSFENPVSQAPFFYDYLGHRLPKSYLWRPWALLIAIAMVAVHSVDVISSFMQKHRVDSPPSRVSQTRDVLYSLLFGLTMGSWLGTADSVNAYLNHRNTHDWYPHVYNLGFIMVSMGFTSFIVKSILLLGSKSDRPRSLLQAYAILIALLLMRILFQEIMVAASLASSFLAFDSEVAYDHLADSLFGSIFTERKGALVASISWILSLHGCVHLVIVLLSRILMHRISNYESNAVSTKPTLNVNRSRGIQSISSRWQRKRQKQHEFFVSGGAAKAMRYSAGVGLQSKKSRLATIRTITSLGRYSSLAVASCVLSLGLLWHKTNYWFFGREVAILVSAGLLLLAPAQPALYKHGEDHRHDKGYSTYIGMCGRLDGRDTAFIFTYICISTDVMSFVFDILFPWLLDQQKSWSAFVNMLTLLGILPLQSVCKNALYGWPGCNTFQYLFFPVPVTLLALIFNQCWNQILVTLVALCVWTSITFRKWRWSAWDM